MNPKKRYSKTGEISRFFQNLPLGSSQAMFVFCGRLANFQKIKNKKLVMIFTNL
jgi:hypothetical protein